MSLWEHQLLPRLTDRALGTRAVRRQRERTVAGLHGEIIEIGFGSGLNVALYPPAVRSVLAVEPSAVARALAATRIRASPAAVTFVGLDGQDVALPDSCVDMALSTFTLCTIPDATRAMRELHRVLRPGGALHFLEHGLAPNPHLARWQHRLTPLQRRVAGGCHLDRPVDEIVAGAGFELQSLHQEQLDGPRLSHPWGYLYRGVAVRTETSPGTTP